MATDWQDLSERELEALLAERAAARGCRLSLDQIPFGRWEARFDRSDPDYFGTAGEAAERRLALAALLAADDMNRAEGR